MASMARDNRRRRVLNEEIRSASGAFAAAAISTASPADAPRYGEQASIEHHPQITDFIPRRKRTVLAALTVGVGVAAAAQAVVENAGALATLMPGVDVAASARQLAYGVAAWTTAVVLLVIAATARIVFSLRRHRVDDVHGRYRVWRWIAVGALVASANAVIEAHQIVARVAAALTGWSLTAGASEWWLAPLAVAGGWISIRLVHELAECRGAFALAVAAAASYGVAAAGALGWSIAPLGAPAHVLAGAMPLVGHSLALAGVLVFARYVVLDVQGLIEHKPRRRAASGAKVRESGRAASQASSSLSTAPAAKSAAAAESPAPAASDAWPDDEEDDEPANRRLSKAERKRLRKMRQGRAA